MHPSLTAIMADPTTEGADQFCLEPLARAPTIILCLNEISEHSKLNNIKIQELADGQSGSIRVDIKHVNARSVVPLTQLFVTTRHRLL